MKLAPNLKKQPRDRLTEVIIFAGSDAWSHAKQWQEQTTEVYCWLHKILALIEMTKTDAEAGI